MKKLIKESPNITELSNNQDNTNNNNIVEEPYDDTNKPDTATSQYSDSSNDEDIIEESYDDEEDNSPYLYLDSKQVLDSDGFYTDYTLWLNTDTGNYLCMFGDSDLYDPDEDYADFVTDSKEEAYEWFENYDDYDEDSIVEDVNDSSNYKLKLIVTNDMKSYDFTDTIKTAIDNIIGASCGKVSKDDNDDYNIEVICNEEALHRVKIIIENIGFCSKLEDISDSYDLNEATNPSSVGQYKRSSVDQFTDEDIIEEDYTNPYEVSPNDDSSLDDKISYINYLISRARNTGDTEYAWLLIDFMYDSNIMNSIKQ